MGLPEVREAAMRGSGRRLIDLKTSDCSLGTRTEVEGTRIVAGALPSLTHEHTLKHAKNQFRNKEFLSLVLCSVPDVHREGWMAKEHREH